MEKKYERDLAAIGAKGFLSKPFSPMKLLCGNSAIGWSAIGSVRLIAVAEGVRADTIISPNRISDLCNERLSWDGASTP